MWPAPPAVEVDSHDARVEETSMGKLVSVPDATEVVEVTVIDRS